VVRFGTGDGVGEIDDLVDGIDGFTFTATAADIKYAGDELVLEARGVREALGFGLAAGDERGHANGLSTVATDNCAISFRDYGR